nr:hypothetical protein [Micromonospora sp. DSM 115978]
MIIELQMCLEDRERLGGPEWIPLDTDRVMDTPAAQLITWEAECGYPIEKALSTIGSNTPPAAAVLVLLWLARKQGGDLVGGHDPETRMPERYARLTGVRTLRVGYRYPDLAAAVDEPEGDVVPPGDSPAT